MAPSSTSTAEGLETAKQLVQRVCRSFYDVKGSIVLDQLIRKEAMRDEELAGRVGMPNKDVAKAVQKLIEDQLISVHRRQEQREGAPKAQTRNYYYMDYSHATDVIKWRVYQIKQTVDVRLRNELDSQGFVCPRCKKSFTHLDAGMLMDPFLNVLACDVCGTEVINNENEEEVKGSRDRMQRLVEQTRIIVDLLKKMEEVVLPKFDIVKWLELNGPQGTTTIAPVDAEGKPTGPAVRIHLAGEDDEAIQKLKREADADAKRAQNQLPTWIANSTISGEPAKAADERREDEGEVKPSVGGEGATTAAAGGGVNELGSPQREASDDLDAYYASLAQEGGGDGADSPSVTPAADYLDAASIALPPSAAQSPLFSPLPTPPTAKDSASAADEDDFEETTPGEGERNGKRSRDEVDSGWEEGGHGHGAEDDGGGKKARFGSVEVGAVGEEEEEEDEDDFEEVEDGDGDPNPMIAIGDKLVPFAEVGDELQAAMTPEEYTAYWEVFQRLG
ncbi:TFIIE alpha subunit-domain-containing protein [Leucosporidium creatinivorum]|uniref:TFIIE alpha subunit-domain-containing protein n=1 Tax=Leucosporidium creatinivorum TaxID=106004 RepID=A0A1Y2G4E7_9BASI|nr:TFIIE alpha subunit-domain-containing protein [Leucosporidium creatinivorum]